MAGLDSKAAVHFRRWGGGGKNNFKNLPPISSNITLSSSKTKGLLRTFWERMDRSYF